MEASAHTELLIVGTTIVDTSHFPPRVDIASNKLQSTDPARSLDLQLPPDNKDMEDPVLRPASIRNLDRGTMTVQM